MVCLAHCTQPLTSSRTGPPFAIPNCSVTNLETMNGSQVLIVDSVPSRVAWMTELLRKAGYRTHAARTFSEAKRSLASDAPHVLITQLQLGPYNGLHLVLRGRRQHPEMGAVVTSRVTDGVLESEADGQGAIFIKWPVTESELLAVVKAALDRPVDIGASLPVAESPEASPQSVLPS